MLEQGVHRDDEKACETADEYEQRISEPDGMHHRHHHDDDAHGSAKFHDLEGIFQFDVFGRGDGTESNADGHDPLQESCLVQWQAEGMLRPFQDDELEGCTGTSEEGGNSQ